MKAYFDFVQWWWEEYFKLLKEIARRTEMESILMSEIKYVKNNLLQTNKQMKDFNQQLITNGIT